MGAKTSSEEDLVQQLVQRNLQLTEALEDKVRFALTNTRCCF